MTALRNLVSKNMNKRIIEIIDKDINPSYLLTEQEHKRYESQLTSEEKRVVSLVEERGVYAFKYGSIMKKICDFISKSLNYNTPVVSGFYKQYPMLKFNVDVPETILNNIDIFESLSIEVEMWNIITNDDIEGDLYGQGAGNYKLNQYDRLTSTGKLPSTTIKVSGFAVNGKVVEHTIITSLYHEINHAADNYNRLKKYGNINLFDEYMDKNFPDIVKLRNSNNTIESAIGTIVYRLWINSEKNALVTSVYSDLKSMKSLRSNFVRDMQKTKAYQIYKQIKDVFLPEVVNINDSDVDAYKTILKIPSSINTKNGFVDYFTKKTNFLLGDLLKRTGKTATLYYDENEGIRDGNNTIKKKCPIKSFEI